MPTAAAIAELEQDEVEVRAAALRVEILRLVESHVDSLSVKDRSLVAFEAFAQAQVDFFLESLARVGAPAPTVAEVGEVFRGAPWEETAQHAAKRRQAKPADSF